MQTSSETEKTTRGHGLLEGFLAKKRAKMANKLIPEHLREGKILDIGCGTTPFFLMNTKFQEKFGLDPVLVNPEVKEGVSLKRFDIENDRTLPFEANFFDVVTMLAVFEHIDIDVLPTTLNEIRRVLKPGGVYILTTPCPWSDKLLRTMAKLNLVSKEEINEHKGAYGPRELRRYLKEGGFEEENMKFGYFELYLNNWATVSK